MVRAGNWPLQRSLTAIAAVVAGVTFAAISLDYIWTAYYYEKARIGHHADMANTVLSKLVYARPDTWIYQQERLSELLTTIAPATAAASHPRNLRIFDKDGALISEIGTLLAPPTITARRPVTDGFRVVGSVELTESVNHIWLHAIPVGGIGLALAIAIFLVLRVLPLRALLQREAALEAARRETRDSET